MSAYTNYNTSKLGVSEAGMEILRELNRATSATILDMSLTLGMNIRVIKTEVSNLLDIGYIEETVATVLRIDFINGLAKREGVTNKRDDPAMFRLTDRGSEFLIKDNNALRRSLK